MVTAVVGVTAGFFLGAHYGPSLLLPVASVNGSFITRAQLYDRMVEEYGSQAVDQLIAERLLDQQVAKAGSPVKDSDVAAELAKLTAQVGGNDQLLQLMASNNITMEQLKANILYRLKVEKVLGKDVPVDDATLQKYFQDNVNHFDKRKIHARHILVPTEAEAKAIRAQLDQGADFAAIAKEKSTDTTTKDQGGDLGTFPYGTMVAEFDQAAFALKVNEISQPVQTDYGWHIIQVLEIQGEPPTFENSKEDVKAAVISKGASDKYAAWMQELRDNAKIINSLDK